MPSRLLLDTPKYGLCPADSLGFLLLLMANLFRSKHKFVLPSLNHVAWMVRMTEEESQRHIDVLLSREILIRKGGKILIADHHKFIPPGMLRPPAREWKLIRERVFARDDYTCHYCGRRGLRLECDHVIPVSRGGSNEDDNLVASCFRCNRAKHDKTADEWRSS
jgi:hypothetical protein